MAEAQLLLKELERVINERQIMVYGESSHYLNSNHNDACEIFKYLVERKGFRVFMLESALKIHVVSNRCFNTIEEIDPISLNAFNSIQIRDLMEWMKVFNKQNPNDSINNCYTATDSQLTGGRLENGHPPYGNKAIGTLLGEKYSHSLYVIGTVTPALGDDFVCGGIDRSFENKYKNNTRFLNQVRGSSPKTKGSLLSLMDKSRLDGYDLFRQYNPIIYLPHNGHTFEKEQLI